MDSNYPNSLDGDLILPRVDDNITEIGGDAINGLRSAVFNIEETLGIDPQGTAADVATRLNQSLNSNGTIKASALSLAGLVTLPITNSQIATNAAIEESKLDLDYTTVQLKTWINELDVFTHSINEKLIIDIFNLSQHIAHPSAYGRHLTHDIDGYTGTYISYNLQGIISDLDTRIINHINDLVDAHNASAIYADDTNFDFNATNVQTALEELNNLGISSTIKHRDDQHNNGIIRAQKVFLDGYDHNEILVVHSGIDTVSAGAHSVGFQSSPTGLATAQRGDVVEIDSGIELYKFNINYVDTDNDIVYFFGAIPVNVIGGTAAVYHTQEEVYSPSNLILTIRQSDVTSVGGSVVQMIHPNAPFLLSNGIDVRALSSTNRYIKIKWQNDETVDIDAYGMMQRFAPTAGKLPSTWINEHFIQALNNLFRADSAPSGYTGTGFPYHYPLIAFSYKGEVGIALDEGIDGYVYIDTPSSNSAWSVLGFSEGDVAYYVTPHRVYVDGYEIYSVRKMVDSTGETQIGVSGVKNINTNLSLLGLSNSGLLRLKNSSDDGTYVYNAYTSNTFTINEHVGFSNDSSVNVTVYADSFAIPTVTSSSVLYELFVDAYENNSVELRGASRAEYRTASASGSDPYKWFDIIDVSRNLGDSQLRIYFNNTNKTLSLGDRPASGLSPDDPGNAIVLPISNPEGYQFKLFDASGVNYVEIEIVKSNYISTGQDRAIDLDIFDRISEEKYIQVGVVLHNSISLRHLDDRRQFGSVGRKDIGNDYTRDYITYPTSLLRGNGVFYGLNVDQTIGKIDAYGGEVLVNGIVYQIERTQLTIPKDGVSSTYNLFIDDNGVLHLLKDNYYDTDYISTPSLIEIISSNDKVIIAQIDINASNSITDIRDYRRFIGNIDNKIELLVEENQITHGSFASLQAAVNYLSAQESGPSSKTIRIKGDITYDLSDGAISIPDGVSIIGDSTAFTSFSTTSTITLSGTGTNFITPGVGVNLQNLHITMGITASCPILIGDGSNDISSLRIENCRFDTQYSNSTTDWIKGKDITYLYVDNVSISVDSSNGDAKGIYATGNMTSTILKHFKITFTDSANEQYGVKVGGNIDDFYSDDCAITTSTTTGAYIGFGSTGSFSNAIIKKSEMSFASTSGGGFCISGLGGMSFCTIKDSTFETLGGARSVFAISSSNIEGMIIKDIQVSLGATTNNNEFITCVGLTNCNFKGIAVGFATTSGSNIGINVTTITNIAISNSGFLCTTSSANNTAITCSTGTNWHIHNCKITNVNQGIVVSSGLTKSVIDSCYMLESINEFISIASSGDNIVICNNVFQTSDIDSASSGFIYIEGHDDVHIDNNYFEYLSSGSDVPGASTPPMLDLLSCNNYLISNNVFLNKDSTSQGIKGAIFVGGSNIYGIIESNIIKNFKFFSSPNRGYGIKYNSDNTICANNRIIAARSGIILAGVDNALVIGNFIDCTTGDNGISIQGISIGNGGNNLQFCGNTIINTEATLVSTATLVDWASSAGSNYIFSGNQFYMGNTTSSTALPIAFTADNVVFTGNLVVGGNFTGTTPILIYGSTVGPLVAMNYFTLTYNTNQAVLSINLSSGVDFMNKGQLYTVGIPMTNAAWHYTASNSGFYTSYASNGKTVIYFDQISSSGGVDFSDRDIPVGAKLVSATLTTRGLFFSTGDFTIQWKKETSSSYSNGSDVSASADPTSGGTFYTTLTPTATTYMVAGDIHTIRWTTNGSFSGPILIAGLLITYIL